MPSLAIPRITRALNLSDYAPEMGEATLRVWVNPTRDFAANFVKIDSQNEDETAQWYSELLSQDADARTHLTADELKRIFDEDPILWLWISSQCWSLITQHQEILTKKPERP